MTPERWEKVKELFEAALERPTAERDAFLGASCQDESVRAEVKTLLSEHQRVGSFLEAPLFPEVGGTVGERYAILSEVGRGGMGIVYRARDLETNAIVALKIFKPEIAAEARTLERFKKEVLLARQVTHKNVCRTYELLRFGDTVVISMEYVDGESLRDILSRSSGVRLRRGLEWVQQACSALAEAHAQGIIHRDLKPENIMIDRNSQVKVMDFGIARSLNTNSTTSAARIGTPPYMSPEQDRGEPVDSRSDIYSLGLVMYEMFTGRRVFAGATPIVPPSERASQMPPPRDFEPYLPEFLDRAVMKCLAKEPKDRFQSVEELSHALAEKALVHKHSRWQLWSVVWGALLLVSIAVASFLWNTWFRTPVQPSYRRITFRRGTVTSARLHPDGRTAIFSAEWEAEPGQLFVATPESPVSRSLGLKDETVLSISPSGEMLLLDKNLTLAEVPFSGGAPREIRKDVEGADWTPDGTRYALVYDSKGNDRLEFPVGRRLYETPGWISDVRFSPEGNLIAFWDHPIQNDDRGSVAVVDLDGNKRTLTEEYLSGRGLAWWPTGREVWFTAGKRHARALYAVTPSGRGRLVQKAPGTLQLYDITVDGHALLELADEHKFIRALLQGETAERDLSWLDYSSAADLSQDGRVLLFDEQGEGGGAKHSVYLRRTDGSLPVRLGDGIAGGLSPDGRWALAILDTPPRALVLLPTSAGDSRSLPRGSLETFYSAEWFPDGKHILLTGNAAGQRPRCYMQDVDRGDPQAITPEGTYDLLVYPDGKSVVVQDSSNNVLRYPAAGGEAAAISGLDREDHVVRFDKDGHGLYLYRQSRSQTKVYRLDTTTGRRTLCRELSTPDPLVDTLDGILLTPDGRSYVCSYERAVSDLYLVEGLR